MLHKYSSVYFLQACIRRWELVGRPWRLRWRDWTSCFKREAGLQELQVVPRPHLTGLTLPPGMATIDLSTYFLGSIIQQKSKVPKIFWPNSLGFGTNSIPSWHKNFKNRGLVTGTNSSILVCINMTFKGKDNLGCRQKIKKIPPALFGTGLTQKTIWAAIFLTSGTVFSYHQGLLARFAKNGTKQL